MTTSQPELLPIRSASSPGPPPTSITRLRRDLRDASKAMLPRVGPSASAYSALRASRFLLGRVLPGDRPRVVELTARRSAGRGRLSRDASPEPGAHRRADVAELAVLVDPPCGVLPGGVRQEQRVLARVVGRRRRRVAAVVRREDQEVTVPQRVEDVGQPAVEVLEAAVEVAGRCGGPRAGRSRRGS